MFKTVRPDTPHRTHTILHTHHPHTTYHTPYHNTYTIPHTHTTYTKKMKGKKWKALLQFDLLSLAKECVTHKHTKHMLYMYQLLNTIAYIHIHKLKHVLYMYQLLNTIAYMHIHKLKHVLYMYHLLNTIAYMHIHKLKHGAIYVSTT